MWVIGCGHCGVVNAHGGEDVRCDVLNRGLSRPREDRNRSARKQMEECEPTERR